jgi:hypothetical protein
VSTDTALLVTDLAARTIAVHQDQPDLPVLPETAIECRLNRHAWKRYSVQPGATFKGITRQAWFTEERYCLRGCGTRRTDPVDQTGHKYPSRYHYDARFQVKGGVSRDALDAIRRNELLLAIQRPQPVEPLTLDLLKELTAG